MKAILALAALLAAPATAQAPAPAHPVIELRQYRIVAGARDRFAALFARWFVDSQAALDMPIAGRWFDRDDPDCFVWIRRFPDVTRRANQLQRFYFGPVWQAHRGEANPLLNDNDNVLLLRPASPALALPERLPGHLTVVIQYLWKAPDEGGFTAAFGASGMAALRTRGVAVLGGYVPEEGANAFPRLSVREHEKVFVWFTDAPEAAVRRAIAHIPALSKLEERPAQILRLVPARP